MRVDALPFRVCLTERARALAPAYVQRHCRVTSLHYQSSHVIVVDRLPLLPRTCYILLRVGRRPRGCVA